MRNNLNVFDIGILAFVLSTCCMIGIAYHNKRISKLTIGLGLLLEEVKVLKQNNDEIRETEDNPKVIIADLLRAYIAKDEDFPHLFEIKAVKNAIFYLKERGDESNNIEKFEAYVKEMRKKSEL